MARFVSFSRKAGCGGSIAASEGFVNECAA